MNHRNSGTFLKERFWKKVRKTSRCWIWTGTKAKGGYGYVCIFYRRQRAHRVAWQLARGPIPEGKKVLHRCDNPGCVRPGHLFLGTQKENVTDMWKKGRAKIPEINGPAWYAIKRNLPTGALWHRLHRR